MLAETKAETHPAMGPAAGHSCLHVIVNDHGEGLFICPSCHNSVLKDLSNVISAQRVINIKCKCKCGHVYQAFVDRRTFTRESVNSIGVCFYKNAAGETAKGIIRVLDVSMSGMRFSFNGVPEFSVGDRIMVEFKLDDWERSQVREEGIVRRIQSNKVGLQFDAIERFGELGLYLLG